jgi:glycosyltransferase involved in cell wall biosynthesis
MSGRRAVHQLLGALHAGDAVGHEALVMRDVLRARGHASQIFAGRIDPALDGEAQPLREFAAASSADHACLLHFAPGSPAGALALAAPDRLGIVFHNVTPPELLAAFDPELARRHHAGRAELRRLASRARLGVAHSEFSRRDLAASGFGERARVVPFAVDLAGAREPAAPVLLRLLSDGRPNLLSVGRIAPNKRLEDVIRAFAALRARIGRRNRLVLAGDTGGFPAYAQSLAALVAELRLDDVMFTGRLSGAELEACYASASAFVCLSEHEGFGVPLVEAMLRDVPVVAYDAGAVAETLRGGGVLLREKTPGRVAELLQGLLEEPALRGAVLATQARAIADWRRFDFAARFFEELEALVA